MKKPTAQKWPATKSESWPVEKLKPYPNNPVEHPPEQIALLVSAIREFGWTVPILADEKGEILAGHGRHLGALEMGLTHVPVVVARGWTDAQKKAYRLFDNSVLEASMWKPELVKVELSDLAALDFNVDKFGLNDIELPPLETPAEVSRARSKTKTTIFVSVGIESAQKARAAIVAALNKAKVAHNL